MEMGPITFVSSVLPLRKARIVAKSKHSKEYGWHIRRPSSVSFSFQLRGPEHLSSSRREDLTMLSSRASVDYSLYLITDRRLIDNMSLEQVVEEALIGGTTVVQLREKRKSTKELVELGLRLKSLTTKYHVPLIVNDRIDVALAISADGVHVGQDDMPANLARKLIGNDMILGVSAGTKEEAIQAFKDGADYIGVGAVYSTFSKNDAGNPIGTSGLREIVKSLNGIKMPVVAIGGIQQSNSQACMHAGASGVAVISAILGAADPRNAAVELRETLVL